jgi:xanthine/CO dehydrogenase XdhC/CoxF family maturation factor
LAGNIHPVSGGVEQMCNLPANACWLVMNDDDLLDFDWIEQILLRGDARFIGLLGCRGKLASFNLRLINRVPLGVLPVFTALWGSEGSTVVNLQ